MAWPGRRSRRAPRADAPERPADSRRRRNIFKEHPPTDAELRAEFETQLASMPLVEYHARHILVSGQDVAQKVIDQLKRGADFDDAGEAPVHRQDTPQYAAATSAGSRRIAMACSLSPTPSRCSRTASTPDASAVAVRLARDPVAGHARSSAADLRGRAGSAQADRAHQEVHRLLGRTAEDREDQSAAGERSRRGAAAPAAPAPAAPAAPAATTPAPAPDELASRDHGRRIAT